MKRRTNENQTRRHRLIGHDYSEPGYYFITFGTLNSRELLGTIHHEEMELSPTGKFLDDLLQQLPIEIPQMDIDCYAIMPNHVHLLIYLFIEVENPKSVSGILRTIKGRTAAAHRSLSCEGKGIWHKGFHDEIIRDDRHLAEAQRYISENLFRWKKENT